METTTAAIIVLSAFLFLSLIFNAFLVIQILTWACESDDLDEYPKCKCSDSNECDIYCIGKKNFHEKHS